MASGVLALRARIGNNRSSGTYLFLSGRAIQILEPASVQAVKLSRGQIHALCYHRFGIGMSVIILFDCDWSSFGESIEPESHKGNIAFFWKFSHRHPACLYIEL